MGKREITNLKGIALILMFWHHLFSCGILLTNGIYYEFTSMLGPLDVLIGSGAKICISIFAFSSGYGMYKSYIIGAEYSKICKSIIKFLVQYWLILFLVAIPYLIVFGKYNDAYLLTNLVAFLHNDEMLYVSLSWYVKVNLLFLIICPLIKLINNKLLLSGELFLYICIPLLLYNALPNQETTYVGVLENGLSTIKLLCRWLPLFYIGVIFAKYNVIEKVRKYTYTKGNKILNLFLTVCVMTGSILINCVYDAENVLTNIISLIIFVVAFDAFNHILEDIVILEKILNIIGVYSFQLWLLSGMFYLNTTEFTWLLYKPKYTVLILIWNIIIIFPIAFLMKKISDFLFLPFKKVNE